MQRCVVSKFNLATTRCMASSGQPPPQHSATCSLQHLLRSMDSEAPLAPTVATSTGQPINPARKQSLQDNQRSVGLHMCSSIRHVCVANMLASRSRTCIAQVGSVYVVQVPVQQTLLRPLTCVVCSKQQAVHTQLLHALLLMQLVPCKATQLDQRHP
jgi:hypothetical protein